MPQGLLFSDYFLEEGIRRMPRYRALVEPDAGARLESAREGLRAVFAAAGPDRRPNEAQTEHDLILPVLDAPGWTPERRLVQVTAERKGRTDVPDVLLFGDGESRRSAEAHDGTARWRHGLVVQENKRWQRTLDRRTRKSAANEDDEAPSTQMLRYLSRAEALSDRRIRWGILTNGRLWRLYFNGADSRAEKYFELDLPAMLDLPQFPPGLFDPKDDAARDHCLALFLLMFGRDSFAVTEPDGRTFHEVALDEGRLWEEQVADNLSDKVFRDLFPPLVAAIDAAHPRRPVPRDEAYLDEVKRSALVLLYRQFQGLCAIVDQGDGELAMPEYDGGLFAAEQTPLLAEIELPDNVFGPVIEALSRHDGRRINYRDLDVQRLGSIYERLLEFSVVERDGAITVEARSPLLREEATELRKSASTDCAT